MCVIVTSQADTMPSLTQLARMSDANPDGAGIAWHDGQRLHRYRNEDNMKTLAFIMDHWQSLETSPFLLHFRLATHGKVCTGNTHPFRFRKGDRTGFIAHNGIAHSYTRGRHASDSRNAILAWQAGQADLTDGSQGRFALIAHNGKLEWLTADHETIPGGTGAIDVSNTNWDTNGLIGYDLWEEAYQQGLEAGYETAIEEMADSGYATTLDYPPPRRCRESPPAPGGRRRPPAAGAHPGAAPRDAGRRRRETEPAGPRGRRRMEPAKGGHGKNTEVWPSSAHRSIPASANPSTPPHTPPDGGASPHDGTALRGVRIR